jgi:hypothetical protein
MTVADLVPVGLLLSLASAGLLRDSHFQAARRS